MAGPTRSGVQRTVELLDSQEQWVQELLTVRPDLTFADVIRWCVDQTMTPQNGDAETVAARVPHRTWKPGPQPGRTSKWPRLKTCVGCGAKNERVRACCSHEDAKPLCDMCHKNDKGNHSEHGDNRRED